MAELARVELVVCHRTGELEVPAAPRRSPLQRAAGVFELDPFERWVLSVAVAAELEPRVSLALARRPDNYSSAWPTVGLVLSNPQAAGVRARVSAFERDGALQAWGLIELEGTGPLSSRIIRLAPGAARLFGLAISRDDASVRSLDELWLTPEVREASLRARDRTGPSITVIAGSLGSGREALARGIAGGTQQTDLSLTARYAIRDAAWVDRIAVVDATDRANHVAIVRAVSRLRRPVVAIGGITTAAHLAELGGAQVAEILLERPSAAGRQRIWTSALASDSLDASVDLTSLAEQFRTNPSQVHAAVILARTSTNSGPITHGALAAAARSVSRSALDELAELLPCAHTLDDLVLPPYARRELTLAISWARHGSSVFARDGAGSRLGRGPGMACMFHGPSGTGKTLGTRVLASAIGLSLFRVDLSRVMDKYIGETEKRLDRLFTEAERGNAILFFDEADVLFAKRTEIGEAKDRYANLETGYLLQRIENHLGICVLATNLRDNFDAAFLRRIHVVVEFPAPEPAERLAIWKRLTPPDLAPDVDLAWIAERFALTGGEINNAVATGLLLARGAARSMAMEDLVFAVWRELAKTGRLVEAGQFGPWAHKVIELVEETRHVSA